MYDGYINYPSQYPQQKNPNPLKISFSHETSYSSVRTNKKREIHEGRPMKKTKQKQKEQT